MFMQGSGEVIVYSFERFDPVRRAFVHVPAKAPRSPAIQLGWEAFGRHHSARIATSWTWAACTGASPLAAAR